MTFDWRNARIRTVVLFIMAISVSAQSYAQRIERSWYHLTTGNGHGFQIFDRNAGRLTDFLEHPYRYVAPPDERRDGGIGRRDLAHDVYFGMRVNGESTWLLNMPNVGYEAESHIIRARQSIGDAQVTVRYFSPFGLDVNAMLMVIEITNASDTTMDLDVFAKPNLKLGMGRPQPSGDDEVITWNDDYGVEYGRGGGHAVYIPIGGIASHGCGPDSEIYNRVDAGQQLGGEQDCNGNDLVLVTNQTAQLEPGESFWWGQAVLFVNDDPNVAQAADFRDDRTVDDILNSWRTFAGDKDAKTMYEDALAEMEAWRVAPSALGLDDLTDDEIALWRQSETVLRMGQVMEPVQENRRNRGMFLAALPIGEWHTGWVRDGAYAIVAQAMNGHHEEAKWGVDFLLGAWAGFFSSSEYLGRDYRISSVRYYGNGKEEGDYNFFGPNVETDGFGLTLWAARAYMHYSCDADWLNTETLHGDTVFEALTEVAADMDALTANDLPVAECSIWEVHWGHKKVFTYTAATMIRGFYDYAAIADVAGRSDLAEYYRQRADAILAASKTFLVNNRTQSFASHKDAASTDIFVDGSTVEMLHWDLVTPDEDVYMGTLQYYERLRTATGGYRRLEERLSLNGEPQAGTYDLSEWILLDLRIGEIFRRVGDTNRANELLDRVTQSALVNDLLIPELFQPDEYAVYTGVVPMVGYGAGAWQMALLERAGLGAPKGDAGWSHCIPDEANPNPMPGDEDNPEMNADSMAGNDQTPGDDTGSPFAGLEDPETTPGGTPSNAGVTPDEDDPFAGDSAATFCASSPVNGSPMTWTLWFFLLCLTRRFRKGVRDA